MGYVLTVANNKGGVGKTTLACNLAHALVLRGGTALVVDMDSQCNSTSLLTRGVRPFQNSLYELLTVDFPPQKSIIATHIKRVDMIPNVSDTAVLEYDLSQNLPANYYILRNKIRDYAKEHYDFTIIDTPPNLGFFSLSALFAADFCIVPIAGGSAYSIEGLKKVLSIIEKIREGGNNDLMFLRLLVNNVDKRTAMSRFIMNQLDESFTGKIFNTHIPRSTVFEQAEFSRDTVFAKMYASSSGAKGYRDLAAELSDILSQPDEREIEHA